MLNEERLRGEAARFAVLLNNFSLVFIPSCPACPWRVSPAEEAALLGAALRSLLGLFGSLARGRALGAEGGLVLLLGGADSARVESVRLEILLLLGPERVLARAAGGALPVLGEVVEVLRAVCLLYTSDAADD